MALIVHKYGGTSMGSTERIKNVAKRVAKWARAGHQMVVVPECHERRDQPPAGPREGTGPQQDRCDATDRELDMIASTGEQASSALLAIALQAEGVPSVSYAGWQVPVRTDSAFTKARIESIDDARVRADLRRRQGGGHHRLPGRGRRPATSPRWAAAAATPRPWPSPRR